MRGDDGLDQNSSGRDYENWLDSRLILKVQLTRVADLLMGSFGVWEKWRVR